ncbi:MAG: hypothetical protein KatS3mg065_0260 [Chloroflexota bacterium]|nr:MAG: hypothetical protein KatS3mg065_0260 [Chloroflexota bacterium]
MTSPCASGAGLRPHEANDWTHCPVCGGPLGSRLARINDGWWLVVCEGCDAGVTWPKPTLVDRQKQWADLYDLGVRVSTYTARAREFRERWNQILALAQQDLGRAPESVLDVGCALGHFLAHARTRGVRRVMGIESDPACREWASSQLGVEVRGDLASLRGCKPFDLITMMDVLEHMEDPVSFLASAAGLLAPDGVVVLQLPNRRSVMASRAGSRWSWYSAPDHLIHLSPASVRRLATQAGLQLKRPRTGDMLGDYVLDVYPRVGRLGLLLRRVPPGWRLWPREDGLGGLIQAVLVARTE